MPERLPKGIRRNLRDRLAQARRTPNAQVVEQQVSNIRLKFQEDIKISERIQRINDCLNSTDVNEPFKTAELELELVWLLVRSSSDEYRKKRVQGVSSLMEKYEQKHPEITHHLEETVLSEDGIRMTRAQQIRNKVIPQSELHRFV